MHFAAGPWFTVRKSGDGFQRFGELWLSNGAKDIRATIEYRVRFAPDDVPVAPLYTPTGLSMLASQENAQ